MQPKIIEVKQAPVVLAELPKKKSTESVYEAMEALKVAIEYFLDSHDTSEEVEWYFKDAIPHLLEGLKRFECLCEEGFSCGCGFRRTVVKEALKELDKIEKEETKCI